MAEDRRNNRKRNRREVVNDGLVNELIALKRVAKVTAGAKRLRFTAVIVVGDKAGKIGIALAHGVDPQEAIKKAIDKAKNKLVNVPIDESKKSVPHRVEGKYKSARVFIKPARVGTGVVAGGAVRKMLEVAGYENVVAKRMGSSNPIANAYCTFVLLNKLRGKPNVSEVVKENKD